MFFKGTAKQIISAYQQFIGKPTLPPFWAYGWHAASYGYSTSKMIMDNVNNYTAKGIPLQGVWFDI